MGKQCIRGTRTGIPAYYERDSELSGWPAAGKKHTGAGHPARAAWKEGKNMDMQFDRNRRREKAYRGVQGTIVSMEPTRIGNRRADGCMMFVGLEDQEGNLVNFLVSPTTFVLDFVMLREGMEVTMYYRIDEPVPLIYPPQYRAAVVIPRMPGQMVDVDYYNRSLVNQDMTLQLNLDGSVDITTTNNQRFLGSPAGNDLVVVYTSSTRSIPAQTTPARIVVLCPKTV